MEKNLQDPEKEITCTVCHEHYTDPKILSCLHYFCKHCIHGALSTGKDQPLSCPECRKVTVLPEGGEDELKSAFFINRIKSMYAEHKKALSKQAHCEMCTDTQGEVEAYCQQCNKFACKIFTCVHSSTFSTHTFQFFESQLPKYPPLNKFQLHGESLEIFCFDCDKSICGHCIVKDHRDHNVEFHSVIAEKKKKELMINLMPIRKIKDSLAHALEKVQIAERGVQAQGDSVTNTIETSLKELHTILETHKNSC